MEASKFKMQQGVFHVINNTQARNIWGVSSLPSTLRRGILSPRLHRPLDRFLID